MVGSGILAMAGLLISASPATAENVWAQATGVTAPAKAKAQSDPNTSLRFRVVGRRLHRHRQLLRQRSRVTQAAAAAETSSTWAQATEVTAPVGSGNGFPGASLRGVSCSSSGNCTAAGSYVSASGNWQAMAAAEDVRFYCGSGH